MRLFLAAWLFMDDLLDDQRCPHRGKVHAPPARRRDPRGADAYEGAPRPVAGGRPRGDRCLDPRLTLGAGACSSPGATIVGPASIPSSSPRPGRGSPRHAGQPTTPGSWGLRHYAERAGLTLYEGQPLGPDDRVVFAEDSAMRTDAVRSKLEPVATASPCITRGRSPSWTPDTRPDSIATPGNMPVRPRHRRRRPDHGGPPRPGVGQPAPKPCRTVMSSALQQVSPGDFALLELLGISRKYGRMEGPMSGIRDAPDIHGAPHNGQRHVRVPAWTPYRAMVNGLPYPHPGFPWSISRKKPPVPHGQIES